MADAAGRHETQVDSENKRDENQVDGERQPGVNRMDVESKEERLTKPDNMEIAEGNRGETSSKGSSCITCGCLFNVIGNMVLALGVSAAVFGHYRNNVYNSRKTYVASADMYDLSNLGGFTARFCESIKLKTSQPFDALSLQHPPRIDPNKRNNYSLSHSLDAFGEMEERSFYLLGGSLIKTRVCFRKLRQGDNNVTVVRALVIRGEGNFENWKASKDCDSCILQSHDVIGHMVCSDNKSVDFTFKVPETDNYYFIYHFITVSNYFVVDFGDAFYEFSLVRYNFDDAKQVCNWTKECDAALDYASEEGMLLNFANPVGIYKNYIYKSECNLRAFYWVLMFFIIPALVAAVISIFWFCLCRLCVD